MGGREGGREGGRGGALVTNTVERNKKTNKNRMNDNDAVIPLRDGPNYP